MIAADRPSGTVIETHLTNLFKGIVPSALLVMELTDSEDVPAPYLLTLAQARRLRDALTHLLDLAALDTTPPLAVPATAT